MITPKRLVPGVILTSSYAQLYVVPTSAIATAKQLVVCNTDATPRKFSYEVRPSSGGSSVAYRLYNDVILQVNATLTIGLTDVMPGDYEIWAKADAGGVVAMTVSGMEAT